MEEIIKACQRRELNAQHLLYEQHVDRLYYIILRYVRDTYFIENILQDVFLKIFNNIDSFDSSIASFSTWSTTIAIRESINHCKKAKLNFTDLDQASETSLQTEDVLGQLNAEEILKVITSIDDKYRLVFNLYEVDGYKHDEIAELLNISVGTSRSSLSRAKKLIREQMAILKLEYYG